MNDMERPRRIPVILEIALATASFLLFKLTRFLVLHAIVPSYLLLVRKRAGGWRVLSETELRRPLALPILLTTGPRWNVHAVVAFVGPIRVRESMRVDLAAVTRSAGSWTLVVHAAPGHRKIVETISSRNGAPADWYESRLRPGRYWLTVRYYDWSSAAVLPTVVTDGHTVVPARPLPARVNDFYSRLADAGNVFYRCLQYYVGPMLRYRSQLPEAFVKREYLPAGNPHTDFRYGAVRQGEHLEMEVDPRVLLSHNVYLAVYDRASLPVVWCSIHETEHATPSLPGGTYLVRLHERQPSSATLANESVRVRVVSAELAASTTPPAASA